MTQMLSVQSPGCAGMERLGTPGGPGGGGAADHQRPCLELNDLRSRMAIQREVNLLMELHARTLSVQNSEALNLPHRIALPDGERGPDRHLQLRVAYQQSELTRSAIQPPPNKSVRDVPDWAPPPPQYRKPPSPHKKDSLMQKAVKYLVKFSGSGKGAESTTAHAGTVTTLETGAVTGAGGGGGTGGTEVNRQAPCVMVPLRPPPAPAPPPPAPPAPPSPPHAPPS